MLPRICIDQFSHRQVLSLTRRDRGRPSSRCTRPSARCTLRSPRTCSSARSLTCCRATTRYHQGCRRSYPGCCGACLRWTRRSASASLPRACTRECPVAPLNLRQHALMRAAGWSQRCRPRPTPRRWPRPTATKVRPRGACRARSVLFPPVVVFTPPHSPSLLPYLPATRSPRLYFAGSTVLPILQDYFGRPARVDMPRASSLPLLGQAPPPARGLGPTVRRILSWFS